MMCRLCRALHRRHTLRHADIARVLCVLLGLDTVDANVKLGFKADERDYGVGASIIRELGIQHMRLMTTNPQKRAGLEGYGITIDEIVPIVIAPNAYNLRYLKTKEERMHHTLGLKEQQ